MRVTCPACNAEMSLELLLQREVDARAVLSLLQRSLPMGTLVMQYVAMFRPPKRRLGLARMAALVEELLPDIERQAITRKGRDWAAPPAVWQAGLQTVLAMRDQAKLTLPLTSHGLLYEVMSSQADKAEAREEAAREAERRNHRAAGPAQVTARPVAAALPLPAGEEDEAAFPHPGAPGFKAHERKKRLALARQRVLEHAVRIDQAVRRAAPAAEPATPTEDPAQ